MGPVNKRMLIEGLEMGPPQKLFGDWAFKRVPRNVDASQIKVVEGSPNKDDAEQAPSTVEQA